MAGPQAPFSGGPSGEHPLVCNSRNAPPCPSSASPVPPLRQKLFSEQVLRPTMHSGQRDAKAKCDAPNLAFRQSPLLPPLQSAAGSAVFDSKLQPVPGISHHHVGLGACLLQAWLSGSFT